jgi:glycosyltransferase involved in cell wall biosynthesis
LSDAGKVEDHRITVVIPAWDSYAGAALVEAIESARAQSVRAEILVVDNASNVPIPEMAGARILRTSTRVTVGTSRNLGLAEVDTPFVIFLDADDLLLEGALEAMLRAVSSGPDAVAWVLGIVDGTTGRRHRSTRRVARVLARRPSLFALANAGWSLMPTQGATLLRVDLLRELGGYDDSERGGDDWPLCAAMAFRGRVAFDPFPALMYRHRANSPGGDAFPSDLVSKNARRVRVRLRGHSSVPRWVIWILPLMQLTAIRIARPVVRGARRSGFWLRKPRSSVGTGP